MSNRDYRAINDYAMLGNGRSAALVARDGSIDWLCWPRFDSPSFFGALLDRRRGGYWSIRPAGRFSVQRRYRPDTLVLETVFTTAEGRIVLTDCMTILAEKLLGEQYQPEHELCRRVECVGGAVEVAVEFCPAPSYGRGRCRFAASAQGLRVECREGTFLLRGDHELVQEGCAAKAQMRLHQGQSLNMTLCFASHGPLSLAPLGDFTRAVIDETAAAWTQWIGGLEYEGPFRSEIARSALVLKSLIFAPSGAVVAAATTSLPEKIGGQLNWDYRFCWLRDASMTVRALYDLGFRHEARAFVSWILHSTRLTRPRLNVLYDVYGGVNADEQIADWLEGYQGSRPVRLRNAAARQFQLDIYGQVISAAAQIMEREGPLDHLTRRMLLGFGRFICKHWQQPDEGIWEPRAERTQHTISKLLCWSGLNRLRRLQRRGLLKPADSSLFERTIAQIDRTIRTEAWDAELGAYTQALNQRSMDAGVVLMAWHGFEDPAGPAMQSTFRILEQKLHAGGGLYYRNEQGIAKGEGAFGICGFWVAEFLARGGGGLEQAQRQFGQMMRFCNDVGLLAEEIAPAEGSLLGNFPQAFSHIGLINAALSLQQRQRAERRRTRDGGGK